MKRAPFFIPALLRFPGAAARMDSWGRLLKLTAGGAELSTAAALAKGEAVLVRFELGGDRLSLSARVHYADKDDDGQSLAQLSWTDMTQRRVLARALLALLSKC